MWHLRRLRLESVGHPDARFAPLLLDFTNADGEPADSVIWLENMGGKTSLLSLAMSTLRPDRREFLGGLQDNKRIEEYVLADDTAHVVIEWQRLGAQSLFGGADAPRLVTGQVLQWRDRRVDLDNGATALQRYFYGFVPTAALGFDTLPIRTHDNRIQPLRGFLEALRTALVGADAFRPSTAQDSWHDWLVSRGLDPEVFRYQLKMNADEGAVATQFQWPSGNAFVQWALSIMIDPKLPNEIADAVDRVRDRLAQREPLELEHEFCTRAAAQLREVAAAHDRFVKADRELTDAWGAGAHLTSGLLAAEQSAEQAAALARAQAGEADQNARGARAKAEHRGRQRNEALIRAGELHVAEAKRQVEASEQVAKDADATVAAWAATDPLDRIAQLENRLHLIDLQLRRHEQETQPLRDASDQAANLLARKLTDQRDRAEGELEAARAAEATFRCGLKDIYADAGEAGQRVRDAGGGEARMADRIDQLDQAVADAVAAGWLEPGEAPRPPLPGCKMHMPGPPSGSRSRLRPATRQQAPRSQLALRSNAQSRPTPRRVAR
jgi:hypothetical protein